jgi:hypothetical protein
MHELTPAVDHKRRARRARNRVYRQRLRDGQVAVTVIVNGAILGVLMRFNWLTEADATDRTKIGAAIARLLEDADSAR